MKLPGLPVLVFWIPWWDEDHRVHGCPIQITVHARRRCLMLRPFSSFAQGGDLRGLGDLHDYEHRSRWRLEDEDPEIWQRLVAARRPRHGRRRRGA